MTLLQRNFVTAKPINFYYLVCKLDRVQYLGIESDISISTPDIVEPGSQSLNQSLFDYCSSYQL